MQMHLGVVMCCRSNAWSKAIFTLIFALIIIQYLFGSVVEFNKRWDMLFYNNNTRGPSFIMSDLNHSKHGILLESLGYNNYMNNYNYNLTNGNVNTNNLQNSQYSVDPNSTLGYENTTTFSNLCPPIPPNLTGRVEIIQSPIPTVQELENRFDWLRLGGHYVPPECVPRYKVAIIIPYRSRADQLLLFLQHMHPFLRKQQIEYAIFIVEQNGKDSFNRAMLMNIGFVEALKASQKFQCFIFHDVDLLPEDDRNLYTCPEQPRHMSVAVNIFKYKLPYLSIFGGVSAMTRKQFELVNGFANSFWGWGGEDDDMSNRLNYHNLHISRYPINIARYTMLSHQKEKANPKRYENLQQGKKRYDTDGLSNLKYEVVEYRANLLYTWILVNLSKPS